jgi:hypothetical protein
LEHHDRIAKDFGLTIPEAEWSEADLLRALADRVDYFMQSRMEELLSLLYRMDVSEAAVAEALHPAAPEPANVGIARLIIERQRQRAATKRRIKPEPLEDEEMRW